MLSSAGPNVGCRPRSGPASRSHASEVRPPCRTTADKMGRARPTLVSPEFYTRKVKYTQEMFGEKLSAILEGFPASGHPPLL